MSAEYFLVSQTNKEILMLYKMTSAQYLLLGESEDIDKTADELYNEHLEEYHFNDIESESGYTVHLSAYKYLLSKSKRFSSFVLRNLETTLKLYDDNTFLDWWHLEYGETPPPCGFSQNYKGDYKVFEL